jgi:hypothetical protein
MERKKIIDLDQGNSYIQVALVRGSSRETRLTPVGSFPHFTRLSRDIGGALFCPEEGKRGLGEEDGVSEVIKYNYRMIL